MTLYSYIVTHDTGFAPNPFFGHCTLACCKPEIRKQATEGDWIVGLTPRAKGKGNKIVYFMRVDEKMDFQGYWRDRRFRRKMPRYDKDLQVRCGDNIYEPLPNGEFRQLRSMHSNDEAEDPVRKAHDLGGRYVLVSETFAYFGSKVLTLPPELSELAVGRGHTCRFSDHVKAEFMQLVGDWKFGVYAPPSRWPEDDKSWMGSLW
jgi:hypothetical protein